MFYAWLIPPPLHGAADPYAQGFVFPDWYVLFSYGYLRWGGTSQFTVPTGFIGDIVGQPVFAWNAAWWGAALAGIPVGILALPPFLGGREKRPVEDMVCAAGAVYLAHVWFISVFSINIFLELYGKNRSDYCKLDSHGDLLCGTRSPWIAEIFNAVPWILTGMLLWIVIYFVGRNILVKAWGSGFTPEHGKRVIIGALVISAGASVATFDTYDNGFWEAGGLLTIKGLTHDYYPELEQCVHNRPMYTSMKRTSLPMIVDTQTALYQRQLGLIGKSSSLLEKPSSISVMPTTTKTHPRATMQQATP